MSPELAALREKFYGPVPELEPAPAVGASFATPYSVNVRYARRSGTIISATVVSRIVRPQSARMMPRRIVRAPRSRRTVRARASRGSPVPLAGDDDEPPLPDVVRLPAAGVLYARAAQLERLACTYAELGRADLFYIGCDLADRLERIADRRAA